MTQIKKGLDIFTGIRPTGQLTVANYLGAIKPIIELQERNLDMMVSVVNLHALTTHEPKESKQFTGEVVLDLLALGLNPEKTGLFIQSDLKEELSVLTMILARHISVAELLRVPTLKDKIKSGQEAETANTLLLLYPVLMAADVLLPRAEQVPVGEDQLAHIEVMRELARRFNNTYAPVFPVPKPYTTKALRILSLKGETKMSKSYPEEALFLDDSEDVIRQKIKRAETAGAGDLTPNVLSLFEIAKGLAKDVEERKYFKTLLKRHEGGDQVMVEFKEALTTVTLDFLTKYQKRREEIVNNSSFVEETLKQGREKAKTLAQETMALVEAAMI